MGHVRSPAGTSIIQLAVQQFLLTAGGILFEDISDFVGIFYPVQCLAEFLITV